MAEADRKIEFDVEALLLAAFCIFLWLSLLSHDPADPIAEPESSLGNLLAVEQAVYPVNDEIQNACGWFGATSSHILIQGLGNASLAVALGLSILAVWMFYAQSNYVRASRQIGWVLLVISIATICALFGWNSSFSPTIGAGGYIGALTSIWLNEHFAMIGSLILSLAVFFAGLLLSTDYIVLRMLGMMLMSSANAAAVAKKRVAIPAPSMAKRRSDVEEGVVLQETPAVDGEPTIVIRGKSNKSEGTEGTADTRPGILSSATGKLAGLFRAKPQEVPAEDDSAVYDELEEEPELEETLDEGFESETETLSESRELDTEDGETLHVRADTPQTDSATQVSGPKIKAPKRKQAESEESDSLAHLDDTKLPAGAEEYVLPGLDLLLESDDIDFETQTVEVRRKAKILESTFKDFGFNVRVVEIETGPVIAQYEIELEAGLRLAKITNLADDLAIALRVPSVRIVAPIPGKNTVGIEVPNETRQVVRLREVIEEQDAKARKAKIPLFFGKDVSGNPLTADLATLPHLLIAGRTGTGKSVCLNAIIASILMTRRPDEVRMLMIDPKMVELSGYGRLPHLMHPVVTDMKKAEAILAWAVDKMEERYALLASAGVRHLTSYNELGREELLDRLKPESPEAAEAIPDHLPFIVIVADEMADLMMTAGKEVEQHIIRLAQKSRAVGIHLILATQKPTVDVITGLIKSNLPARIAFQVASRTDSRVVLDEMGADRLLGNGDMLFLWPGTSMLLRGQGTYLGDEEINAIVDHCSTGEQNFVNELVNLKVKEDDEEGEDEPQRVLKKRDALYEAAVDVVVREGRGSCSLLQRSLGIGYGRAARLIDFMAEDGIVGEYNGSQAREVLMSVVEWESMHENGDPEGAAAEQAAKQASAKQANAGQRNKILPADEPQEEPFESSDADVLPWESEEGEFAESEEAEYEDYD